MDMGQKINDLRMKNGMTLEELGNKVGVGKSTVRKWENGMIANMKRDKILKVAEALDTTPAYLMGWENTKQTFAQNITKNRLHMKLTLEELASLLNIHKSTLYNWENETSEPNQDMKMKLCQIFSKTYDDMFGLSSCSDESITEDPIDNECIIKILGEAKELSDDSLNRLLIFAKKLRELEELEQ